MTTKMEIYKDLSFEVYDETDELIASGAADNIIEFGDTFSDGSHSVWVSIGGSHVMFYINEVHREEEE